MIANTEVLKHLASHCDQAETGTFFITTIDNKACHIVIEQGRITALSYQRLRGEKVVAELPFIQVEGFSFKAGVAMPLSSRAYINDELNILELLGLHHGDDAIPEHSKKVYRGVELAQERELPTLKKAGAENSRKKTARMYRGRVLED